MKRFEPFFFLFLLGENYDALKMFVINITLLLLLLLLLSMQIMSASRFSATGTFQLVLIRFIRCQFEANVKKTPEKFPVTVTFYSRTLSHL